MSMIYVIALASVVVLIAAASVAAPTRVNASRRRRLAAADTVALVLGLTALAFHCGSMFYRSAVGAIPGAGPVAARVDALGLFSMVAYAVPAAVVVIALRTAQRVAVALVVVALAGVGVTMYDSGPLPAHLTAIFAAVVLIALTAGFGLPTVHAPRTTPV